MLNRKYNRIFLLLSGKNEGISMNLNGSCDIEIINGKAKLYSYVGGIGRLKKKEHKLYLIFENNGKTLAVPAGNYDSKGSNAVLEGNVDPDDVFGSGMAVENIAAAAIWNESEGPYRAVLEGFVSQRFNWQKNLKILGEFEADNNINDEPQKNLEPLENPVKKEAEQKLIENELKQSDETIEAAEAPTAYYSPHDTFREIAEKFRRELDMLDEMGIVDKTMILGNESGAESNEKSAELPTEEKENKESKRITTAMDADMLFLSNAKLTIDGATEWVQTDYRELYFIPGAIKSLRQLFVRNGARKGRHLIAGRNDEKYYIGVPGNENQRKSANANGFYDFLTIGDMDGVGYWIKEL
ncbi:MAG: hypothetical protein LUE88_07675 [Clostridiales bacterium]|nr:hypothetical protein [Clostridiales bacterium]